jgi:K+ transporter
VNKADSDHKRQLALMMGALGVVYGDDGGSDPTMQ